VVDSSAKVGAANRTRRLFRSVGVLIGVIFDVIARHILVYIDFVVFGFGFVSV